MIQKHVKYPVLIFLKKQATHPVNISFCTCCGRSRCAFVAEDVESASVNSGVTLFFLV
jgi:hypothetical protein